MRRYDWLLSRERGIGSAGNNLNETTFFMNINSHLPLVLAFFGQNNAMKMINTSIYKFIGSNGDLNKLKWVQNIRFRCFYFSFLGIQMGCLAAVHACQLANRSPAFVQCYTQLYRFTATPTAYYYISRNPDLSKPIQNIRQYSMSPWEFNELRSTYYNLRHDLNNTIQRKCFQDFQKFQPISLSKRG